MNIKKILKITLIVLVSIVVLFIVVYGVWAIIYEFTYPVWYGVTVGDCTCCRAYITEEHIFKDKLGGHYCTKCNYDSTVEGEISLRDPDKFN